MFNKINIYSWINILSKLLTPLFVLPLLMAKFKAGDLELWFLVLNIMSLTVVFDFGYISLQNRLYAYCMKSYHPSYQRFINSNFNTLFLVISVFWLAGLMLINFIFLKGEIPFYLPFSIVAYFLLMVIQNILFSYGKIVISKNTETIFNIIKVVLLFTLVKMSTTITTIISYFYNVNYLGLLIFIIVLKVKIPDYKIKIAFSFKFFKKYFSAAASAWIATFLSNGLFYISSIYLVERYNKYDWSSYLFTFRVIEMLIIIGFVPFYSRIPLFVNQFKVGDHQVLKTQLWKNITFSATMYVGISLVIFFVGQVLLKMIKSHSNFIGMGNFLILLAGLLAHKLGACFLQISAFNNKVKWHIAHLYQTLVLFVIYFIMIYLQIEDKSLLFILPFLISALFVYLPYSIFIANREFPLIFKFK